MEIFQYVSTAFDVGSMPSADVQQIKNGRAFVGNYTIFFFLLISAPRHTNIALLGLFE